MVLTQLSHWSLTPALPRQARAGFLLNIIGVLVITLAINSWSYPIFHLHSFPTWADSNNTAGCLATQANATTPAP